MLDVDVVVKMCVDVKEMGIVYYDIFYILKDGVVIIGGFIQFCLGMLKFVDINGDGIVNDDDCMIIGNMLLKYFGGFMNNFSYKNIDFFVLVFWFYGNDIYNKNLNKGNVQVIFFFNKYC